MKWMTHVHEGLLNLVAAKLRSSLALLGILVGTASVVAMVMGGELATNEALKQFKLLGTDLLAVTISESNPSNDDNQGKISLEQINHLPSVDKNILAVAPYVQTFFPTYFNNQNLHASIVGVTQNFAQVVHVNVEQGRFISDLDGYSLFCVIGHDIYQAIKNIVPNPIGQQIQIGQNIFTIVGVAEAWPESSFVYVNIDHSIMIPAPAAMTLSKYATINNIVMQLNPHANGDRVQNNVQNDLQKEGRQLFFRNAKELINKMSKQSDILTIFLGLIGGVSLIVGGIGVMNIMLVSVIERRREIGIRLAVGATPRDIRSLFLAEAMMLSLFGGALGVVIGIAIAYIIAIFSHWEFTFFFLPPVIGFAVSVATGIFFGFYPAHKASRLDPIHALRSD